jgi:hypothetical protein
MAGEYAQETLPALQMHLEEAPKLQRQSSKRKCPVIADLRVSIMRGCRSKQMVQFRLSRGLPQRIGFDGHQHRIRWAHVW